MVQRERGCDSHSVLGLRVWLARQPFRLAPAWATLAGALASGGLRWQRKDGLLLLLAIILADGLWGQLWTLLVRQHGLAWEGHAVPTARLLLNSFEFHLGFSSVCSVSLWLNDLFQGSH